MNKNVPDYEDTFSMVEDELIHAEKKLLEKRKRDQDRKSSGNGSLESKRELKINATATPVAQSLETKSRATPKKKKEKSEKLVVIREAGTRKSFTLKVLEENEVRFHQLFCQLQLKGDTRKKQELADEALELLFSKYGTFLENA